MSWREDKPSAEHIKSVERAVESELKENRRLHLRSLWRQWTTILVPAGITASLVVWWNQREPEQKVVIGQPDVNQNILMALEPDSEIWLDEDFEVFEDLELVENLEDLESWNS